MLFHNSGTPCLRKKKRGKRSPKKKGFLHSRERLSPLRRTRTLTSSVSSQKFEKQHIRLTPSFQNVYNITSSNTAIGNVGLVNTMNPHFAVDSISCFFTRGSLLDECKVLPRTGNDVSSSPAYLHQSHRCKRGLGVKSSSCPGSLLVAPIRRRTRVLPSQSSFSIATAERSGNLAYRDLRARQALKRLLNRCGRIAGHSRLMV